MTHPIRVVVIDDVPSTVENLTKLLGFEPDIAVVGSAGDAEAGLAVVTKMEPDVVLMDVNLPGQDGIRATERLTQSPAAPPVILMSVQDDREYLRRAMQAGAREFLVKPFGAEELGSALRRVHQLEQVRRHQSALPQALAAAAAEDADAPAAEPPPDRGHIEEDGQIAVLFSGKGGVGKSTLAVNLAAAYVRMGESACVVDLDLQFGDIGVLLGLESGRNIYQVVEAFPNIDHEFAEALMPRAPGGFRVLLAPQSPEYADLVTAEHTRAILELLRRSYQHVIVDTASHLGEVTLEALERAATIAVVVELSLPAVKEAKLALRVFERLGIPRQRIKLLLNRADVNSGITAAQVESSLDTPITGRIPYDGRTILRSVQRAEPFVSLAADAEISQRVREFAIALVPSPAAGGGRAKPGTRKLPFWRP